MPRSRQILRIRKSLISLCRGTEECFPLVGFRFECACCLLSANGSHGIRDGGSGRVASRGHQGDFLFQRKFLGHRSPGQIMICPKCHLNGFDKVFASFGQGCALGVGSGQLLNPCDIAFRYFLKNCCQFHASHAFVIAMVAPRSWFLRARHALQVGVSVDFADRPNMVNRYTVPD
jgi:hypothetical protein